MKKLLLLTFLFAFVASIAGFAQNQQRTRNVGNEKYRDLIENYRYPENDAQITISPVRGEIIFSENFNEAGLDLPAGWTKDGSSSDCTWKMDNSPADPGYYSAGGSLNFNNGYNFECDEGDGNGTWGAVTTPLIQVNGNPITISFMFNQENECNYYEDDGGGEPGPYAPTLECYYDETWMAILDENEDVIEWFYVDGTYAWNQNTYEFLNPDADQYIKVQFYFDTYDDIANDFYGPFIDDLTISQAVATPIPGWALIIGISLMVAFTFFRIRRQA